MKNLLKTTLILAGALCISAANATVHTVTVQNISFSPATFNAVVGDTVEWVWASGTHTTTSRGIPNGAATWNNDMNSSSTIFKYKITTAGTYNYWCAIHTTMMEASFTVTAATGVQPVTSNTKPMAKFFPNPATNLLNIHLNINPHNNTLIISDIQGKELVNKILPDVDNTIDISSWKKGVYLYRLKNGEETMEGKFEVE